MHVIIFFILLTVIQPSQGVTLQVEDAESYDDIDSIFNTKPASEQEWLGDTFVSNKYICVHIVYTPVHLYIQYISSY